MLETTRFASVAVLGAAVLWGTTGTLQAFLPSTSQPIAVGAFRLLFGSAALVVVLAFNRSALRTLARLPKRKVFFAGIGIAAYNLLFFWAVREAGVGVGTVVAIGSAPLFASLFALLSTRRLPSQKHMLGQFISISGVIVLGLSGATTHFSVLGLLLALAAGASYTAYTLTTSSIDPRIAPTAIAASTFSIAAILSAPALFLVPIAWTQNPQSLAILGFLGVIVTGLAYFVYTWGLRYVTASTAVTLVLAEPLTAWLLSIILIGEAVTVARASGAAMIVFGVWLVAHSPDRNLRSQDPE